MKASHGCLPVLGLCGVQSQALPLTAPAGQLHVEWFISMCF